MKTMSYTESRARYAEVLDSVVDDREEVVAGPGSRGTTTDVDRLEAARVPRPRDGTAILIRMLTALILQRGW